MTRIADTLERGLNAARAIIARYAAGASEPGAHSSREGPPQLLAASLGAIEQTRRCLDDGKRAQCQEAREAAFMSYEKRALRKHDCGMCHDLKLIDEELEGLGAKLKETTGQITARESKVLNDTTLSALYRATAACEERTGSDANEGD